MKLQERNFLLLSSDKTTRIVKEILKSPLGLAGDLVTYLNENRFSEIKNNLDKIKQFVAGINRAESLKTEYRLAQFYPNLFAFHQFFNSPFRARQGKVLEANEDIDKLALEISSLWKEDSIPLPSVSDRILYK